jgi:hypothetical protein
MKFPLHFAPYHEIAVPRFCCWQNRNERQGSWHISITSDVYLTAWSEDLQPSPLIYNNASRGVAQGQKGEFSLLRLNLEADPLVPNQEQVKI